MTRQRIPQLVLSVACGALACIGGATSAQASEPRIAPASVGEPVLAADATVNTPPIVIGLASENCAAGNACFWKQNSFEGDKVSFDESYAGVWRNNDSYDRSTKNKFGNRLLRLGDLQGGSVDVVECLDAGEIDGNLPARVDSFKIGGQGSDCTN